jgi:hypothetical protein
MKMETSELTGAALDWAVTKCEGFLCDYNYNGALVAYSTDWAQGGPIIEREKINTLDAIGCWGAHKTYWDNSQSSRSYFGSTPLIAAMRCYCASNLGYEVDVPDELC